MTNLSKDKDSFLSDFTTYINIKSDTTTCNNQNKNMSNHKSKITKILDDDDIYLWKLKYLSNDSFLSSLKVFPLNNDSFKEKYRKSFLHIIKSTSFVSGEDNQATAMFSNLLIENKDCTLALLQEFFLSAMEAKVLDESLIVKILSLLNDYDYDALHPYSQTIALSAFNIKSLKVQSATFNLFGHWGNEQSLRLLEKYNEPSEPWLKMKYNSLLRSLKKKCYLLGK